MESKKHPPVRVLFFVSDMNIWSLLINEAIYTKPGEV